MKIAIPALAAFLVAGTARAHNHLTVDTSSGSAGDHISIRAGYLPAEAAYSIDETGRLLYNGEIAVYEVLDQLTQGGNLHGWYAGDELLLTSDFYYATGRLDGGDFEYELVQLAIVQGGAATAAWGNFGASGFSPSAVTGGATRDDRSYHVGLAGHSHSQGYAFSAPGIYDLTLIAWDRKGTYLESKPIKIRFKVGTPGCPADFDGDGFLTGVDFDLFVAAFESGDMAADFDGDGFLTGVDFDLFVGSFESGC